MKTLLSLLLLLVSLARSNAQGVTQLADIPLYQGNPSSLTLIIPAADSSLTTSALMYSTKGGRELVSTSQPTVIRNGRRAIINWSAAQTKALDPVTWLQIGAGSLIRYQAWVNTSKTPAKVTAPGSLTVVSPVVVISASPPGSTSQVYRLASVPPSGYVIVHNKANRLVRATFYPDDTGQPDALWHFDVDNGNSGRIRGPSAETFSGQLTLEFITQPISN